jgi:hypothetical protein
MNEEIEKIFQVASEEIDKISGSINDDMVFRILLRTAKKFGYRISISHCLLKTYKFEELNYELEFPVNFPNLVEDSYVIEYRILLDIIGMMISLPNVHYTSYPSLEAYHLLRHALSMAKFQIWKIGKGGAVSDVIEEVVTCDFTEIPPSITAVTFIRSSYLSGSDTAGVRTIGQGGSLRWNYRTLNSKTDLISYSKDYLFTSDSPIFVKLVFDKNFLDDKLCECSNLELIRLLEGYITCAMKTLKIQKV